MPDIKVEHKSEPKQPATTRPEHGLSRFGEYWPTPRDFFTTPLTLLRRLSDEMDRAFGTSVGLGREMSAWWPAVEIKERGNDLVVCADLPGLTKDDVKVEFTDQGLVIRGERKREHEETKAGWHRSERSYGEFYRTIPLPEGVNADRAQAQFKDGVLEVKVPLPESAQHKAREIPIKT
jgi:HSP20 family protein